MDSITQAALGATVGELVLGRKLGWRAAAWGAFFGTLPDLDVLATPWLDEAGGLASHRGISHSLLVMILAPLVLGPLLAWLHRARSPGRSSAILFVFLIWSTHVLIDVFTSYGTQVLEPFSDHRLAFDNLFIIDLFFTGPLLLSLALIFFFQPTGTRRRKINGTALTLASFYALASFGMKAWATNQISKSVPEGKLVATTPTISNIVLWRGLVETGDAYLVTYWSPFDQEPAPYDRFEKNHHLIQAREGERGASILTWFSKEHWIADTDEAGRLYLAAMRMGELRDSSAGTMDPVFQWELLPESESGIRQIRPNPEMMRPALSLLWERIWGNQERWNRQWRPQIGDHGVGVQEGP